MHRFNVGVSKIVEAENVSIAPLRSLFGGLFGQFTGAFCGAVRVSGELSFRHFAGFVVDNFLGWRAVEIDADGIAKNSAAIGVAAFPHMKHAARIAGSPAKRSGDLRQNGAGQRPNGFLLVENCGPFGFQDFDLRPRFFDPA